ncbi:MAG: N-6 DNA methylase [bacterium]
MLLKTELDLAAAAVALGAENVKGWSSAEKVLTRGVGRLKEAEEEKLRRAIGAGRDPLGDAFGRIRSPEVRRSRGATYTPPRIIQAMLSWAARQKEPARVVDPGCGSCRFLVRAARRFPDSVLVGVETDPLAALISRANLAAAGVQERAEVILGDYRSVELGGSWGETLFLGNPPYVRHHLIEREWKSWLGHEAASRGLPCSRLAGLHIYFFLATLLHASPGDLGILITAAEWLDVNYGKLLRHLVLGELGGKRIVVIEPTAQPFPDAATTAAITAFEVGARPSSVYFQRAKNLRELGTLTGGRRVRRERLEAENRWSHFTRVSKPVPDGYVELGELCRVHRGQVTGANHVWIERDRTVELPEGVLFHSITRARELFEAGLVLDDVSKLRRVIDLPVDLSVFDGEERRAVERFLRRAKKLGADKGYVAQNRRAWWSVGLREPAPILATYMARRPPAFVQNRASARHINIAHGLYPREALSEEALGAMAEYLSRAVETRRGRTYAGGLTKFEPREMERLPVPLPELLAQDQVPVVEAK